MSDKGLKDARLLARLVKLTEKLGQASSASFPQVFEDPAEVEACYRFFSNVTVTPEAILAPHYEDRVRQCKHEVRNGDYVQLHGRGVTFMGRFQRELRRDRHSLDHHKLDCHELDFYRRDAHRRRVRGRGAGRHGPGGCVLYGGEKLLQGVPRNVAGRLRGTLCAEVVGGRRAQSEDDRCQALGIEPLSRRVFSSG